jgi:FKBP-type peptidyl-prolyl cis-trans isomerase FklB
MLDKRDGEGFFKQVPLQAPFSPTPSLRLFLSERHRAPTPNGHGFSPCLLPCLFAKRRNQCQNIRMQKQWIFVLTVLATGAIFLPLAHAQQTATPAAQNPSAKAAPQAPAATAKKPGTAKSAQASASKTAAPPALKTDKDKISYAIGINMGKAMKRDGVDVDPAILLRAIKDVLSDGKLLMTDQEVQSTLTTLQTELRKKQELQQQQLAETNKKEGEGFLAANKAKEGVVTLASGLQYKILQEGTGPKPTAADTVTVNYRGTLLNGTEFDSSYKHGQPASFPVSGIIKGWTEALQLMPVGSKWQLFIPAELAYGPRQAGPTIGPNSTLVFEVELISIQPKPAPAPAPASAPTQPSAAGTAPAAKPAPTPKP